MHKLIRQWNTIKNSLWILRNVFNLSSTRECSHIRAAGWVWGSVENVSNVVEAKPRNEDRNVYLLLIEHWVKPYLKPNNPLIVHLYGWKYPRFVKPVLVSLFFPITTEIESRLIWLKSRIRDGVFMWTTRKVMEWIIPFCFCIIFDQTQLDEFLHSNM